MNAKSYVDKDEIFIYNIYVMKFNKEAEISLSGLKMLSLLPILVNINYVRTLSN